MDTKEIAAKRGWQTLVDGLIVVAVVAGIMPLINAIQSADGWTTFAAGWAQWTWSAFQGAIVAAGTAGASWLRRRFIDPA